MSENIRRYYLDNFRGFQDTFIELADVNFLVGENSSGKTSIVEVISLLSGQQFWFQMEFGLAKGLSNIFSDLVSKSSARKDYFTLGMLIGGEAPAHYMMTFSNNQGLPRLRILSVCLESDVTTVVNSGARSALVAEWPLEASDHEIVLRKIGRFHRQLMEQQVAEIKERQEFEERTTDWYPASAASFFKLSAFIEDARRKKSKDGKYYVLGPPAAVFQGRMTVIAPIRSKAKRTYDEFTTEYSAEGAHTPYLIRENLLSRAKRKRFQAFLRKFGRNSGLFDQVQIRPYSEDPVSPFELDVQIGKEMLPINTVGYGVSQALPIVVECFLRPKESWFAIQQPEVHLHPRAQAAFGEAIFDTAIRERKRYVIETHSDYLIDRFRIKMSKSSARSKPSAQVLFFEHSPAGFNRLHPIQIEEGGSLSSEQPRKYRKFFVREQLELLGL